MQCQYITPIATMAMDASCPQVFRTFVGYTTEVAWIQQSNEQREVRFSLVVVTRPRSRITTYTHAHHPIHQGIMTAFCSTTCGQTYTQTLTARRRGCTPPTPKGAGAAMVPDGPTAFPTNYPGLRLGCVMDAADGQFCAVKMGAPQGGDCHFYKSCECSFGSDRRVVCSLFLFRIRRRTSCMQVHQCSPYHHNTTNTLAGCYGELAAQAGGNGIDPAFFAAIDRICPGMFWIALLRYRIGGWIWSSESPRLTVDDHTITRTLTQAPPSTAICFASEHRAARTRRRELRTRIGER